MSVTTFQRPARQDLGEPTYHCIDCKDEPNGWRVFWCPGVGDSHSGELLPGRAICARRHDHYPHSYVERCGCIDTNPVIQTHRLRMREAAVKRVQREKVTR